MPNIFSLIKRFNLVRGIPLFSKLNWLEIRRIAKKAIVEEYKKGDFIRKEGDPPDFFYCLVSGRVQSYKHNFFGHKENVEFIHRGMHLGVISALTGEAHSLTYEALNDSVVLKIPRGDFHNILKYIPQLGVELSQILSKRVRSHVQGTRSFYESKIISIYSPTKGSGSSTYAVHLALSLQKETKKKVILINIYPKQKLEDESSRGMDASFLDLKHIDGDSEKIFSNIVKDNLNIHLLNVVFDVGENFLKKQISPLVSTLVGDYHYVIVDLPNEMDDFVLEALTQSDLIHLVTLDQREDLGLTRRVIDNLELTFKERFKEDKIHIILRSAHDKLDLSFEEIGQALDFSVYTVLPFAEPSSFKPEGHSQYLTIYQCDSHSEYAQAVTRIARQIGGVRIGLALGGGAALGIAHIGIIKVLEEENIPVDIIVGSSMGAIIGGLWAIGNNAENIKKIAQEFSSKGSLFKLIDPVFPPKSGLIAGGSVKRWAKKHFGNKTFYETKIPFKATAYDLIRRQELVLENGLIIDALRKSIAIPGVIEPVRVKDQLIIDGGVLNPLPTNVLADMGIKKIIAVNVLQSPEDVSHGFDMFQQAQEQQKRIAFLKSPFQYLKFKLHQFNNFIFSPNIPDIIVRTLQASEYVIAEQSARKANIVIHPDLVGFGWFELYRVDDLIERGEQATRALLPKIKKLIEE